MKRISNFLFLAFLTTIIASSCSSTATYSQLLDDEQTLISAFIKRNNIQVVTTFPSDSIWNKNGKDIYVKTSSGLYFHMVNYANVKDMDTLLLKNTVVPRFKEYTLNVVSDTISNWNTIDFPYPPSFIYGNMTQSCKGFQEAVTYMKRNDSEALLIIPSIIGFNADMMSVTPMGYDLKIKILK